MATDKSFGGFRDDFCINQIKVPLRHCRSPNAGSRLRHASVIVTEMSVIEGFDRKVPVGAGRCWRSRQSHLPETNKSQYGTQRNMTDTHGNQVGVTSHPKAPRPREIEHVHFSRRHRHARGSGPAAEPPGLPAYRGGRRGGRRRLRGAGHAGGSHRGDSGGGGHRVPPGKISIQLYTLRDQLAADFTGTLAALAEIGYRRVEHAGFVGRSVTEFKAALDAVGIWASSGHVGIPQPFDATAWQASLQDALTLALPLHRPPVLRHQLRHRRGGAGPGHLGRLRARPEPGRPDGPRRSGCGSATTTTTGSSSGSPTTRPRRRTTC